MLPRILFVLLSISSLNAAEVINYTGPNFTNVVGNVTTADSITGTVTFDSVVLGSTCTGIGTGVGECDITDATFSMSGASAFTMDFSHVAVPANWSFTFDGTGQATAWALGFGGNIDADSATESIITNTSIIFTGEGSRGVNHGVFGTGNTFGSTLLSNPGSFTPVLEPSSLLFLALLATGFAAKRRYFG